MKIRPAETFDIPAIARIGASAFATEPIYTHFFPLHTVYPQDFHRYFVDDTTNALLTPGKIVLVVELEGSDILDSDADLEDIQKEGKVVAFAIYVRYGSSSELASWNPDSPLKKLKSLLLFFRGIWASITAPNQAISMPTIENYYSQALAVHSKWLELSRSRIEFKTLAVDPAYQRRGFGEKLVEWCGMKAWEEDVQVFGDASTNGLPLYLRNGCEDIGRIILPKKTINPGNGLEPIELDGMDVVVLRWKA